MKVEDAHRESGNREGIRRGHGTRGLQREICSDFSKKLSGPAGTRLPRPQQLAPSWPLGGSVYQGVQVGASERCSSTQPGSIRGTRDETQFLSRFSVLGFFCFLFFCINCDCFNLIFQDFVVFFLIRILRKNGQSYKVAAR